MIRIVHPSITMRNTLEFKRLAALSNNAWDQEHHSLARFNANCYRRLAYQKMVRNAVRDLLGT